MPAFSRLLMLVAILLASGGASGGEAARRVERLLPEKTLAMVSVGNLPQWIASWNRLGFRAPQANPALRAVLRRVQEQLPPEWGQPGPDWQALSALPSGEACMAVVESKSGKPVIVLAMEVRARHEKAAELLGRLGRGPKAAAQPPAEQSIAGTRVLRHPSLAYFIKDDLLVAATETETALEILRSWPGTGGMVQSELYRAVMRQCRAGAEGVEPQLRCFLRPIQYLAVRFAAEKRRRPVTAQQYLDQARQTGFDAIRGVGGVAWLARGARALDYRIAVYAPDPNTTAMRVLVMPNRPSQQAPAWIPGDVAGFSSFSWKMQQAFEPFAKLLDMAIADLGDGRPGLFEEILEGVANDPNGPQIDVRAEFIRRLGNRVLVLCGPERPGKSVWDRGVFAFEVTDQPAMARAVSKYCDSAEASSDHGDHRKYEVAGHVVHEFSRGQRRPPPTRKRPAAVVPNVPRLAPKRAGDKPSADKMPLGPVFVTVAHGHVLWGNNGKLLKRLLEPGKSPLAADPRYRAVEEELRRTAEGPASFHTFSRTGDDFRLLARCMDPEKLYTPFFLEAQEAVAKQSAPRRQPPLKPSPPATSSPGPAGWLAYTLPDGWRIVGFVLKPAASPEKAR